MSWDTRTTLLTARLHLKAFEEEFSMVLCPLTCVMRNQNTNFGLPDCTWRHLNNNFQWVCGPLTCVMRHQNHTFDCQTASESIWIGIFNGFVSLNLCHETPEHQLWIARLHLKTFEHEFSMVLWSLNLCHETPEPHFWLPDCIWKHLNRNFQWFCVP